MLAGASLFLFFITGAFHMHWHEAPNRLKAPRLAKTSHAARHFNQPPASHYRKQPLAEPRTKRKRSKWLSNRPISAGNMISEWASSRKKEHFCRCLTRPAVSPFACPGAD
jgi:hypothetical protein